MGMQGKVSNVRQNTNTSTHVQVQQDGGLRNRSIVDLETRLQGALEKLRSHIRKCSSVSVGHSLPSPKYASRPTSPRESPSSARYETKIKNMLDMIAAYRTTERQLRGEVRRLTNIIEDKDRQLESQKSKTRIDSTLLEKAVRLENRGKYEDVVQSLEDLKDELVRIKATHKVEMEWRDALISDLEKHGGSSRGSDVSPSSTADTRTQRGYGLSPSYHAVRSPRYESKSAVRDPPTVRDSPTPVSSVKPATPAQKAYTTMSSGTESSSLMPVVPVISQPKPHKSNLVVSDVKLLQPRTDPLSGSLPIMQSSITTGVREPVYFQRGIERDD